MRVMKAISGCTAGIATALSLTLAGCGGNTTAAPSAVTKTIYASTLSVIATSTTSNETFKAAMRDWTNRSNVHFKELGDALIAASICGETDVQCMRDECTTAHKSLETDLKADLPSPDPKLTDAVNSMIDDFDRGMHTCMNLPDYPTAEQVAEFESYIDKSQAHFETVKSIRDADLADP